VDENLITYATSSGIIDLPGSHHGTCCIIRGAALGLRNLQGIKKSAILKEKLPKHA